MDNVTVEKLEKKFPGEGEKRFREIADKGGFGAVGEGEGSIPLQYPGGLDIRGVVDPSNTAFTDAQKSKLADLAGMGTSDRERIESGATTSSADKIKGKEK